jgi:hypothetical protein
VRPETVYRIEPFGDRWVVIADGEPLVVTETEADAARLAQGAISTLVAPRPASPTLQAAGEPRSFADGGERRRAFGFPVVDVKDGN